MLTHLHVIYI